ncbi:glycoside hydrolase family 2 protein [Prolixibacter denitrificans]|uniref:Beta-glucuronidase n=1 Tax=Prolixibacter denitrificans TaxID=1541063 RepID=A0A2P8C9J8_9BACT|nr:glycoside hydrolase family 2 TIM barrel-domain containing protein [Prolixibacter denitrificans]PSK81646.1 beta-glucuronidase [Prolixibacter denitrificans]GET21171.1 beta-glucuronidase [Prolixibacter denitrificans]
MKKLTLLLCLIWVGQVHAQTVITNIPGRNTFTLNGKWHYIIDPYETGYYDYRYKPYDANPHPYGGFFLDQHQTNKTQLIEYNFDKSPTLWVPGDWNSQDEKLLYYEGSIWYRKLFDYKKSNPNDRVFIHFGAVNYESDVYLNGKKLGKHIGGFTPFNYEITDLLKKDGKNSLVLKVDNKRHKEGVPTLNTDWWNYGGITRDVDVVEVPQTFISDYYIQLKKGSQKDVAGYVKLNGPNAANQTVQVSIPELKINKTFTTDENGKAAVDFQLKKAELWSPKHPKLYKVTVSNAGQSVSEPIGFRSIETKGTDILLNGKSMFLRGICIHEEMPMRGGRAYTESDARTLLNWAKELGCNYVRLAHYPHAENMIRLADKMGILVWEENPVYWTIDWSNPGTYKNAEHQLTDLITRDKNRASVIIWSMANETPVSDARTNFLRKLTQHARSMDSTRLISAALEVHGNNNRYDRIVEDPFAQYVDIINFNEYVGWYDGLPEKCDSINWIIKYNKPVMVSEFGGGALQGLHGDSLTRWSEEYQESIYKHTLPMLMKIPQFRGVTPWILCDFRSPKRVLPVTQDGWNRKGLIGQNGTKKKAFFVLQKFYKKMEEKDK